MVIRAATLAQRATDLILGETPSEFTPEKPEVQPETTRGNRSKGAVLYVGQAAAQALQAIMPEDAGVVDPAAPVFGLSASQIGRRIDAAAKAAGLGEGFTGHSGRVGMAQDLAASGVELPELMTAGRWKSSRMPARYTERQTAGRGAVARYYQGRRG